MKIALDSNIIAYAVGVSRISSDDPKIEQARDVVGKLGASASLICSWQALGETYNVMLRAGYTREQSKSAILKWQNRAEIVASSGTTFIGAFDLATEHKLQIWDALILNAAADAGSALLLSEDMQPGFVWRGTTVANPFAEPLDRTLARAMAG